MSSPFPGMNPYLEHLQLWREVHNRLIVALADAIEPNLSSKYRVAIEQRTYLSDVEESILVGIPDVLVFSKSSKFNLTPSSTATLSTQSESMTVTLPLSEEVRENYLEIRDVSQGYVVTLIEILSPTNKRLGEGREAYQRKRKQVLASPTHLIEIDLLRSGKPMRLLSDVPQTDYRILVARQNCRPHAQLFGFSIRQEIPKFLLPLESGDTEPLIDLQSILMGVYERARFNIILDYTKEPVPPLKEEDRVWADELLREKGLR